MSLDHEFGQMNRDKERGTSLKGDIEKDLFNESFRHYFKPLTHKQRRHDEKVYY